MNVDFLAQENAGENNTTDVKIVGGITPFSNVDYPGMMSAVIFFQGCPWRCRYCYNSDLWQSCHGRYSWKETLSFLRQRRGLLEAVVFSGGEPTLNPHLKEMMQDVIQMDFKVGLHTGGAFPTKLEKVIELCDWIGMDIKAPFFDYEKITGIRRSGQSARRSARLVISKARDYEFRTTWHTALLSSDEIRELCDELRFMGAKSYALQKFSNRETVPLIEEENNWNDIDLSKLVEKFSAQFERFTLRAEQLGSY